MQTDIKLYVPYVLEYSAHTVVQSAALSIGIYFKSIAVSFYGFGNAQFTHEDSFVKGD